MEPIACWLEYTPLMRKEPPEPEVGSESETREVGERLEVVRTLLHEERNIAVANNNTAKRNNEKIRSWIFRSESDSTFVVERKSLFKVPPSGNTYPHSYLQEPFLQKGLITIRFFRKQTVETVDTVKKLNILNSIHSDRLPRR